MGYAGSKDKKGFYDAIIIRKNNARLAKIPEGLC